MANPQAAHQILCWCDRASQLPSYLQPPLQHFLLDSAATPPPVSSQSVSAIRANIGTIFDSAADCASVVWRRLGISDYATLSNQQNIN